MVRGFAVAGLVVAACQFPRPGDRQPDAGPDAPIDAPVDARAELVFGRWDRLHTTPAGVTAQGIDLSAYSVSALVPNGAGHTSIGGVGRSDGTFELDDVPPGAMYLLRVGRLVAVTDQHEVQLGTRIPTRAAVPLVAPTLIDVTLQGLLPMLAGDVVTITSRLADAEAQLSIATNASKLSESFDASAFFSTYAERAGLPSSAADDDLFALHSRTSPGTALTPTLERIVAAADISATALRDGEMNAIAATLSPPSAALELSAGITPSSLSLGYSSLTRPRSVKVVCAALPAPAVGWSFEGRPAMGRAIVTATYPATTINLLELSGSFPDPFPPAWPRFCDIELTRDRSFRVPGASTARTIAGGVHRVVTPAGIGSSVMPPPTVIRIAGRDGDVGGLVPNTGAPVEVTWTGAAQATQFVVSAYELRVQSGPRLLAAVMTRDTRVELPPELLSGADFIAFVITAFSGSNDYDAGELAMDGVPGSSASAVTAMFRWSATCGNGAPDLGEDCDASGASATCDADCTAVMCGDGTRNAAAGELCDSIVDTLGCDDDCTANTCGDGHRNEATEQCDDGGIAPGDGCSATCRTE